MTLPLNRHILVIEKGEYMNAKEKIMMSALSLFNEHGCNGTSIKMIIDESGVSNGGLYHHFKTKEKIVYDLYNQVKTDMLEYLTASIGDAKTTRETFRRLWTAQIEWSLNNWKKKKFIDYITYSHFINKFHSEEVVAKYEQVFKVLFEAMENGEIITVDKKYFGFDFMGNIGAVIAYIKLKPENNNQIFIDFTFKKYWRSIVNI